MKRRTLPFLFVLLSFVYAAKAEVPAESVAPAGASSISTSSPSFSVAAPSNPAPLHTRPKSVPVIAIKKSLTFRIGAGYGPIPGGRRQQVIEEEGFSPIPWGLGAGISYWFSPSDAWYRIGFGGSFLARFGTSQPVKNSPTLHERTWFAVGEFPVLLALNNNFAAILSPRIGYGNASIDLGGSVPGRGAVVYGLDCSLFGGPQRIIAVTPGFLIGSVTPPGVGGEYKLGGVYLWVTGFFHV